MNNILPILSVYSCVRGASSGLTVAAAAFEFCDLLEKRLHYVMDPAQSPPTHSYPPRLLKASRHASFAALIKL